MKAELLAPAGSYESMTAAFAAGADAVYIGGTKFGARAYADNLDREAMIKAIDYAHLKGKKLYLTVNTLLKDREMEELYGYLNPFYREGLDAAIVQDMGVLRYLKREFPHMELHASTQMTITGIHGAKALKEAGASRVVTARELSLKEIAGIHKEAAIEIESFIHGALCFCYSGQCLYSSMLGGRSGNRGRCAQPCRLPYSLTDGKKTLNAQENRYLLSPKDICTLQILPQILESGVYSLKIEGRMKRMEYTAGVVQIYRRYLDRCLYEPDKDYQVKREDMEDLMDLYNRGGFSKGYYVQHNGADMMSFLRPNHWGTEAARIVSAGKYTLRCRALKTLEKGDVLEYRAGGQEQEFVLDRQVGAKEEFSLKAPKNRKVGQDLLYRTKKEALLQKIASEFAKGKYPQKINGKLILSRQKCAILAINFHNLQIEATGEIPQPAQNRPLRKEDLERQLRKTGGTQFQFDKLEIELDDQLFMPMQSVKELRRRGIETLCNAVIAVGKRDSDEFPKPCKEQERAKSGNVPYLAASVETEESLAAVLNFREVKKIYLESILFESRQSFEEQAEKQIQRCHAQGKQCFYVMPWIFREKAAAYYDAGALAILEQFDGVLIKNAEEYQFLKTNGYKKQVIADYNLYTWNREARVFWQERGIAYDTAPLELNAEELRARGCAGSEILIYGFVPLMVSAQCQLNNTVGCCHQQRTVYLKDRKHKLFAVRNQCSFCYNLIYNSTPMELLENAKEVLALQSLGVRLGFTTEDEKKTAEITESYIRAFCKREAPGREPEEFTRGHFKRGVE